MIDLLRGFGRHQVVVWRLSLDLPDPLLRYCLEVLSPDESARMRKFHRPHHRRRYGASQGLLRWLLAACLGRTPKSLQFVRHRWGKPCLRDGGDLNFNISHSRECLLVAVSRYVAIGVDVEAVHPLHSMEAMARRCFAAPELAYWSGLPRGEKQQAFFRLWTLKEALMKATGRGLGMGVERCVFSLDPLRLLALPAEYGGPDDWWPYELAAGGGFKASLCVQGGAVRVTQHALPAEVLLSLSPQAAAAQGVEDGGGSTEVPHRTGHEQ